jgi:protein-tyrosine phosphatase
MRTSETHPIYVNFVHEGSSGGRIGVTFAPGKKDPVAMTGGWDRDLATDLDALVAARVHMLVSLVEDAELAMLKIPTLVAEASARGLEVVRFPIVDVQPPREAAAARAVIDLALARVADGKTVVFHCRGGLGRAGTMAACALVGLGQAPEEAIARVRQVRPGAIETREQERFVLGFQQGRSSLAR